MNDLRQAAQQVLEVLKASRRSHHYCEDKWYSCPKHEEGCANEAEGDQCNCGADKENEKIDQAINALKQALAEPEQGPVEQALEALNKMQSILMMKDGKHPRDVLRAFIQQSAPAPQREHITDGSTCWCNPDVIEEDGGNVIVHNYDDNWQQYAKPGETAQQCIERHRAEQDALMKLYATQGKPVGQLQEEACGRGQVVWFKKPADQSMLYTAPPQRKPVELTDGEIERNWLFLYDKTGNIPDYHDFARAVIAAYEAKSGITGEQT